MSLGVRPLSQRPVWRAPELCHFCRADILYTHHHRDLPSKKEQAIPGQALSCIWLSGAAHGLYRAGQLYLSVAADIQTCLYLAGPRHRTAGHTAVLLPAKGEGYLQPPPTLRYRLTAFIKMLAFAFVISSSASNTFFCAVTTSR